LVEDVSASTRWRRVLVVGGGFALPGDIVTRELLEASRDVPRRRRDPSRRALPRGGSSGV